MSRIKILPLLIFITLNLSSQISVESFTKREKDMRARIDYPKIDQNGDNCALIIIETPLDNLHFYAPGSGIFHAEQKVGEWWIYVSYGARLLTIQHPQLGILRDYRYPLPIEKATVYLMKLTSARIETVVIEEDTPTEWIIIDSEPSGAQVYIDDSPVGQTPYQREYAYGKYNYRIEMLMYHNEAGVIELNANTGRQIINEKLRPNYGNIKITSVPESGADILLDGRPTGKKTPATLTEVPSGTHNIRVKLSMYHDAWREIVVQDEKTTYLDLTMKPAFGVLNIKTEPESEIYIDDKRVGHGTYEVRKTRGFYTIEARKEKHESHIRRIEVKDNENFDINLHPTPKYGQLRIVTTPLNAEVFINEKKHPKKTPVTIGELLIGDYNIEIKRQGYATLLKNITIQHNETTDIEETLADAMEVTITSEPAGAKLKINGQSKGTTPYTGVLNFGKYNIKIINNEKIVTDKIKVADKGKKFFNYDVCDTIKVRFTSEPNNANLFINEKNKGTTPCFVNVSMGDNIVFLKKQNYIGHKESIIISKNTKELNFKLTHDYYNVAKRDYTKYALIRYSSLALMTAGLGLSVYHSYNIYDKYNMYQTATVNATELHNDIIRSRNIFLFSASAAVISYIPFRLARNSFISSKQKLKSYSFMPIKDGLILSMQISF